ncbi:MAG: hypothetical protein KKH98_14865 [Spirochaetes bacterium]|nr:hypothetical protein [Spirochaetota bacterium]
MFDGLIKKIFLMLFLLIPFILFSEKQFEVHSFKNRSNFKDRAQFGADVAELFITELRNSGRYEMTFNKNMDLGGPSGRDGYHITGIIKKFSLASYGLIFPAKGGYVHYASKVIIEITVFSNGEKVRTITGNSELRDNSLGITILGGPGTSVEVESLVYKELQKVPLGSKKFKKSLLGRSLYACLQDLSEKFKKEFTQVKKEKSFISTEYFLIADREKNTVYINSGSSDFIKAGEILQVFRIGKRLDDPKTKKFLGYREEYLGKIKVIMVLSELLSKAEIIEGGKRIKKGDRVRR